MDTAAAAIRYSHIEVPPPSPLVQALLLAGLVLLLSLFVGFVFWRVYRTARNR